MKKTLEPTYVLHGGLRLELTRTDKWWVVSSLDDIGLHTQGKTIDEALENALDAKKTLDESRRLLTQEMIRRPAKGPAVKARGKTP